MAKVDIDEEEKSLKHIIIDISKEQNLEKQLNSVNLLQELP